MWSIYTTSAHSRVEMLLCKKNRSIFDETLENAFFQIIDARELDRVRDENSA